MNPVQLLALFDRLADAPDAIPRLRRFILDLAVRGKLVEQDPKDEPASELLKQIQAKKSDLVARGTIKNEALCPLGVDEPPFSLPYSWKWARFVEVAAIQSNLVKPDKFLNHPHIAPDNIEARTGRLLPFQTIRESKVFSAKHRFFPGHIVYSKIRPALGKAALVDFEGLCSADMYPILPFIDRAFLLTFMLSEAFISQSVKEDTRVAMPKINQEALSKLLVVVPPQVEQRRIVARVNEIMALCDKVEMAKAERESRRDRLIRASLHRLNQPDDDLAFRDHARFTLNNLSRISTRPEYIPQLRQTILNLAVRGKLVPQDPTEEPAKELLKRIQFERHELIGERLLKEESQAEEEPIPFELPATWQWVQLQRLMVFGPQNGISPKPTTRPDAPKAVTLTATTKGTFDPTAYKSVEASIPYDSEFWLREGDLLFQRGNTREYVGIAAYYTGEPRTFLYPDLMIKIRVSEKLCLRYVHLASVAPHSRSYFSRRASGAQATMPKINQGILQELLVPIPPIAEQRRIVAKVDELAALCDRLESQLTTSQNENSRLLEAVLHQALNA